jgi:hypothetical protein
MCSNVQQMVQKTVHVAERASSNKHESAEDINENIYILEKYVRETIY